MTQNLFGPSSIFFPPYLASAVALTVAWLALKKGTGVRKSLALCFAPASWLSRSSRLDLGLTLFHLIFWRSLVGILEAGAFAIALDVPGRLVTFRASVTWPPLLEGVVATLVAMVGFDFASYVVHRALHRFAPLWRIHRLHHSAEVLTPLTTYRQHPLEPVLLNVARFTAAGLALGSLRLLLMQKTPVITFSGLGAGFFIYMFTVNLHHWTVPVDYPVWVQRILISPRAHHLHHSADPRHHDRNFGVIFSVWDHAFGTYLTDAAPESAELRFGL